MPSGYTASVADGKTTTLRDFALQCARGMGALIMMRDDPWDAPIPERFEPRTTYHDEALAKARAVLEEVPALTDAECGARAQAAHAADLEGYRAYHAEDEARRVRYEAMIAQVEAWDCDAEGLKPFMLDQLRESLRFDCGPSSDRQPVPMTAEGWREQTLAKAKRGLDYHTAERAKEIERTEARNAWLKALRESLPGEAVPA